MEELGRLAHANGAHEATLTAARFGYGDGVGYNARDIEGTVSDRAMAWEGRTLLRVCVDMVYDTQSWMILDGHGS